MKALLVNGSPHKDGSTNATLEVVSNILKAEGIDSEIFYIGIDPISPCRGCYKCKDKGLCIIDDKVNDFVRILSNVDALVLASPVHYASASGIITTFLDRAFFVASRNKENILAHKPGFSIAVARRAGTTFTFDQLNKYFTIAQMPIISGRYWNVVHGSSKDEVMEDKEGIQNLRILARNLVWFLKCKEAGEKQGIFPPETEEVVFTNFIR